MIKDLIVDGEVINHYEYNGVAYCLEIFYIEGKLIKVFAAFQADIENETDDFPGIGEHPSDKEAAIIKAIHHLHSQYH